MLLRSAPAEQEQIEELKSKVEEIETANGRDGETAENGTEDKKETKAEEQELRDMFADFEASPEGDGEEK